MNRQSALNAEKIYCRVQHVMTRSMERNCVTGMKILDAGDFRKWNRTSHRKEATTIEQRICPHCDKAAYSSNFRGAWGCPSCGSEVKKMAKHTTGPWKARSYVNHSGDVWVDCYAFANKGKGNALAGTIATVHASGKGKEGSVEANAQLIASAPEMYEALSEILTLVALIDAPLNRNILKIITLCEQATAKAQGLEVES